MLLRQLLHGCGDNWLNCSLECGLRGHHSANSDSPCSALGFSLLMYCKYFQGRLRYFAVRQPQHIPYVRDSPHVFGRDLHVTIRKRNPIFPPIPTAKHALTISKEVRGGRCRTLTAVWSWRRSHLGKTKEGATWTALCHSILFAPAFLENQSIAKEA